MSSKPKLNGINGNEKAVSDKIVTFQPKNEEQKNALETINQSKITFLTGMAGTGKTAISIGYALQMLLRNKYKKLIIVRPAILAGENLGWMPGDYLQKLGLFLIPAFDCLGDYLSQDDIHTLIKDERIRIIPLGYLRGITIKNSILVAEEFQNSTPEQMRMLLTRIGDSGRLIINGDLFQSDLSDKNGLQDAVERLQDIEGINFVHLSENSVVRDPIIKEIENRYNPPLEF